MMAETEKASGGTVSIFLNKTIRLFLDSIGRREEYEYYLERFRANRPGAFALLCPMSAGFEDAVSVFAFDLEFLLRLELDPVILLCGPDADKMRQLLFAGSHPFAVLPVDVAEAKSGDPTQTILDFLENCRQRSQVAVIVDPSTPLEDALRHIVPSVSRRVHFIRVRGPLHDAQQAPLYYYHTQHADRVELADEDRDVAGLAGRLLAHAPGTHISVASPLQLLQELFTVKGAGCVVRQGSEIHHLTTRETVQEDRLIGLLESSFGRALTKRSFLDRVTDLYIEADYRGAALLEPHGDTMYLSKFAVSTEARGEGLAVELWRVVTEHHPALFWRSRVNNPINHWYDKQADGYHQQGEWKIFWRGIAADRIPDLVAFALQQEEAFALPTAAT
jgi:ribosomal protein S18 acetylase RimI-like enzyme